MIPLGSVVNVGVDGSGDLATAPPSADADSLEGETDDIVWFVPPEERYGKPPAA